MLQWFAVHACVFGTHLPLLCACLLCACVRSWVRICCGCWHVGMWVCGYVDMWVCGHVGALVIERGASIQHQRHPAYDAAQILRSRLARVDASRLHTAVNQGKLLDGTALVQCGRQMTSSTPTPDTGKSSTLLPPSQHGSYVTLSGEDPRNKAISIAVDVADFGSASR